MIGRDGQFGQLVTGRSCSGQVCRGFSIGQSMPARMGRRGGEEEEEKGEEEGVGISEHNHREAAAANNMQYAQTKERSGLELVVVVQRQILWWRSISS